MRAMNKTFSLKACPREMMRSWKGSILMKRIEIIIIAPKSSNKLNYYKHVTVNILKINGFLFENSK